MRLAAIVLLVLLVIGVPLAYWLTFSTWRGKFLVEAVVALPLVLPPTVLGFYVLVALGRGARSAARGALDRARPRLLLRGAGHRVDSYSLPFAVQPFAARSQVDRALIEASATLGAGRRCDIRARDDAVSAGHPRRRGPTFAHTIGEFGVVLMVGGNLPGRDAHRLDLDLRRRAGAESRLRPPDRAPATGVLVRRARRRLRADAKAMGRRAAPMSLAVRIHKRLSPRLST